MNTEVTLLAVN